MKPFVFRLDAVLMLRESEKQVAFDAYGVAIRKRQKLEETCHQTSQYLHKLREIIAQQRQSVFPAALQPAFMNELQDGEENLQNQLKQLARAEQTEQEKLDAFLEAKTRVDVLEKLKQKRRSSHQYAQYKEEEKELDDLVNARYAPTF